MGQEHSEYIVYVDESGDHGLVGFDENYPMFVLAFCVFTKTHYVDTVVPEIQRFKFKHFGHDMVVLHEREIRKCKAPFEALLRTEFREGFFADLNGIMEKAQFDLIACAIDKKKLVEKHGTDEMNPYHVAMESCLKRLWKFLSKREQELIVHVIFEERGKNEDRDLELEFRRFVASSKARFEIKIASKKVNSCGLQLADLVARPIGRHILDGPGKSNRAFDILRSKMRADGNGDECEECFVDVFPAI